MSDTLDDIAGVLPEEASNTEIASICGFIITSYSTDGMHASQITRLLIDELSQFYSENGCSCDACVASRKKGAH